MRQDTDQMQKDYKMSMSEFHKLDYNWIVSATYIEYKRALKLGDKIIVKTQIDSVNGAQSKVKFRIIKKENGKNGRRGLFALYNDIQEKRGSR
ncbi:MAG: thioesterase [Ignavibacteriales bacterium]|nr:thioesterase [Ignavibacteriales bacterium]